MTISTKPQRITKEDVNKEPWVYSPSQYQFAHNVHEPWVGEISPWQYANLGKRAKAEYDRKRSKEWSDSMAIKGEWSDKVIKAFREGLISPNSPDISKDAGSLIYRQITSDREEKEKREEATKEASRIIRSPKEVKVGDFIDTTMYGKGLKVVKINPKSLVVQGKFGKVKVQIDPTRLGGPVAAKWPVAKNPTKKKRKQKSNTGELIALVVLTGVAIWGISRYQMKAGE